MAVLFNNGVVTFLLVLTVWFANFAEALGEGRGKAKAAKPGEEAQLDPAPMYDEPYNRGSVEIRCG